MNRKWGRALVWLLCLSLVLGLAAQAFAEDAPAEAPAETKAPVSAASIIDNDALQKKVEDFLAAKNVPKDRVGIGFCYTATEDEWFLNPDQWFYPGSMYKVPLMMDLAERVKSGEVSEDTQIGGLPLDTVFEYILVYSNNDYAHRVRTFLGGDEVWREEAKEYARLADYDERYMLYCYFSPRYMTQVMETLYKDPDRFPRVMDNLLKAEQAHYFRLPDEMHPYDIAQKYGSYLDNEGSDWNHTTGIIYTAHPFILTVMTKNVGGSESLIGQLGAFFKDYALELDEKLSAFQQEQERLKEEERRAAELTAQQPAEETEPRQFVQQPVQPQQTQAPAQAKVSAVDRADRGRRAGIIVLSFLLAAAVIGGIGAVIIVKERERRRYESYRRRFEAELRQEALEREQAKQREARPQAKPAAPPVERASRPAPPPRQPQPHPPKPQPPRDFDESLWANDEEDE